MCSRTTFKLRETREGVKRGKRSKKEKVKKEGGPQKEGRRMRWKGGGSGRGFHDQSEVKDFMKLLTNDDSVELTVMDVVV